VARPRSDAWLWILNAVVIGTVVLAAAAAATTTGHTVVAASDHFLLYYAGVLALVALTAEVGIGLVASDRIFMKPNARVTAQALHRAMGFGAIAFLVIHIVLEIIAGRSQPADAVIPFLDKGKTFYLGLGTVASDMFIVIMMTGIYRARLAERMSPKAWRVIHASAYAAWIFGLVHGLLAGRPAKSFFGFSGFVAWSYGACVVAVAAALMVRLVAKNRAGNELASHPVSDSAGPGGWSAAAAALTAGSSGIPGAPALTATAMPAPALAAGAPGALDGSRPRSRQPGRAPLALPAGASAGQQRGRQARSAPYDERAAYLADTRRIGASGPIGAGATGAFDRASQFGGVGQDPRERRGQYEQTGPLQRVGPFEQTGPMPGLGQYERPGYQPERTGQIDRLGQYGPPQRGQVYGGPMQGGPMQGGPMRSDQAPFGQPTAGRIPGGQPPGAPAGYGPPRSGSPQPGPARYGPPGPSMMPRQQDQSGAYQHDQTGPYERPHDDWSGPLPQLGPPAAAPRYAAGNYNDWSGPLERIDPAAPPSRYGAPAHYGAPGQFDYGTTGQFDAPGQFDDSGWFGGSGEYERPRAEPRYEQTGEIDRSAPYAQPQYGSPAGRPSYGAAVPQYGSPGYGPPGYGPPAYGREDQSGPPMPPQPQPGQYERPHPAQYQAAPYQAAPYQPDQYQPDQYDSAQYQSGPYHPAPPQRDQYQSAQYQSAQYQLPPGYERDGQPGQYQAPMRYEEPVEYDQYQRGPGGPPDPSRQYRRPDPDPHERAAHYATFADQDASYTRPRPPGARDQFGPQDETDPLNVAPLNTGNYT
jgi:preprotein translocase subunit SecG